jgi:hypothetical protein
MDFGAWIWWAIIFLVILLFVILLIATWSNQDGWLGKAKEIMHRLRVETQQGRPPPRERGVFWDEEHLRRERTMSADSSDDTVSESSDGDLPETSIEEIDEVLGTRGTKTPRKEKKEEVDIYTGPLSNHPSNIPETIIINHLSRLFGVQFVSMTPRFLTNPETGRLLELDAYYPEPLPDNPNIRLAVEYQGEQHSERFHVFNRDSVAWVKQLRRDQFKREMCAAMGVLLIEVPSIPYDEIEDYLDRRLEELSVVV